MIPEITPLAWTVAIFGACLVGLGKGGIPGAGNLTIALYALVFPAHLSVGILLPVLIAADLVAVTVYRRYPDWKQIRLLLPWALVGIALGSWVLSVLSSEELRRLIGGLLLAMTALHFIRQGLSAKVEEVDPLAKSRTFAGSTAALGGFATMTANAAGPIAAIYFLVLKLPKLVFIGTMAWYFFIINLIKMPLQMQLDMVTSETLRISWILGCFAALSALSARFLVAHIPQKLFERIVWLLVIVGAGLLLAF